MDETAPTTHDPTASQPAASGIADMVDAARTLPERRPLRTNVVRTLAVPEPQPRPVVVGRPVTTRTKRTSDLSGDSLVAVAVIAALIGTLSLVRTDFVTGVGTDDSPVAVAPVASRTAASMPSAPGLLQAGPSRVDWGDDFHHLVVTTVVDGAGEVALQTPSPGASSTDLTPVARADGTTVRVEVPDESLELAVPTRDEAAAVRSLGADSITTPIVVVDVDGVAGEPMTRYIQVDGRLVEPGAAAGAAAGEPAPAATTEFAEADVVATLLAVPEVVQVTQLAPGLLAVATREPLDDLGSHPGVLSVADDVLLGVATLPGSTAPTRPVTAAPTRPVTAAPTRPVTAAPTSAPLPTKGVRPIVAVIDTGFDPSADELAASWWHNDDDCDNGTDDDANGYVDDCRGWDFGAADADPSPEADDPHGDHGTEVASVIGSARNGSGVIGVAPGAAIMPLKVSRPTGAIGMSAVAAAVDYAVANGADVVNLSLITRPGVDRRQMRVLEEAIDRAGAAGVVVVAGAGNDGQNLLLTPAWPASLGADRRHVLTVGALDPDGVPARFSNQGDAVTFAAPGTSVPVAGCAAGTVWRGGTSYSTPIVAGLVATVLAEQAPRDLDALLAAVVARTTVVDGVHLVASAPVVDVPSGSSGDVAPEDPRCHAPSG